MLNNYIHWLQEHAHVLVLSGRCQLVVMGKHASACGVRDSRRHHVLRRGSLIGPRSAGCRGMGKRESLVRNWTVWIVDVRNQKYYVENVNE